MKTFFTIFIFCTMLFEDHFSVFSQANCTSEEQKPSLVQVFMSFCTLIVHVRNFL